MFRHDHLLRAEFLSSPHRDQFVRCLRRAGRCPTASHRAGNRPPFALPAYISKYVIVTDCLVAQVY